MAKRTLAKPWRLAAESGRDWRHHAKLLVLITGVVTIPSALLQLLLPSGDTTVSAYITLAALVMNLALIWAVVQLGQRSGDITLKRAYYHGTAGFVRFLLVSMVLVLEMIPLALSLLLYSVGVVGAAPGTSLFEIILIGLLALFLALPSFFWFIRTAFSLIIVPGSDLAPVAALKKSWRSVKGHSWAVLARLLGLVLAVLLLMVIPTLVLVFAYERTTNRGFLALLQVFASLVVLPFINLYLYKLYQELS